MQTPKGIYYSAEHDNFYSAVTRQGMGENFHAYWRAWSCLFPQSASSIRRKPTLIIPDSVERDYLLNAVAALET